MPGSAALGASGASPVTPGSTVAPAPAGGEELRRLGNVLLSFGCGSTQSQQKDLAPTTSTSAWEVDASSERSELADIECPGWD